MKRLIYGTLIGLFLFACVCVAAPEPAIVQGPGLWLLDVKFEHPQQIEMKISGQNRRFWYVILTLTNNTRQDVDFFPKCELVTDSFQIIPAQVSVPPVVFEKIKKRHQRQYPFLESLEQISTRILEGDDNTKDIAIIFSDFDAKAKAISFYVAGMSNETVVIDHPVAKDAAGNPEKIFLRRTLELSYSISGDPKFRSSAKIEFKGKRWVMR